MFPTDEPGFAIDDQYYIGSSGLLVKPVTEKNAIKTIVYLGEKQVRPWTNFRTSRYEVSHYAARSGLL